MDERQLTDILKSEEIPPADDNARKRAMNLALAAFDDAQREKEKKRQGSGGLARLMDRLTFRSGRRLMTRPYLVSGMAIVLLGAVTYGAIDAYRKPEFSGVIVDTSRKAEETQPSQEIAQLDRPADPTPRTEGTKKERRIGDEKDLRETFERQAKPDRAIAGP